MKLGKVFIALEDARTYRDMFDSLEYADSFEDTDSTYDIPLYDCKRLAEVLDVLIDLATQIEVGD